MASTVDRYKQKARETVDRMKSQVRDVENRASDVARTYKRAVDMASGRMNARALRETMRRASTRSR